MRVARGLASETEGRKGSQTGLREGGRYLHTPHNRRSLTPDDRPARHHETGGVLLTLRLVAHDQLQAVTHFRVSPQGFTPVRIDRHRNG